jgi:hypothetical protein
VRGIVEHTVLAFSRVVDCKVKVEVGIVKQLQACEIFALATPS